MGELTNALQGKLNSRKGQVKDPAEKQLDLFSSLADRERSAAKMVMPEWSYRLRSRMIAIPGLTRHSYSHSAARR